MTYTCPYCKKNQFNGSYDHEIYHDGKSLTCTGLKQKTGVIA